MHEWNVVDKAQQMFVILGWKLVILAEMLCYAEYFLICQQQK